MTDDKTPTVGYMNPPEHTRFKKGTSGNPRGRPRKRENPNTVFQRVLKHKIRIKEEDRRMPIEEALIRKLREFALRGDKQALSLQLQILSDAGYDEPEPDSQNEKHKVLQAAAEALRELVRKKDVSDDG